MSGQKIATRLFIGSSIVFGIFGMFVVFTIPANGDNSSSDFHMLLTKLMFATVMVILPSFALSVAGKYLSR